MSQIDRSGVVRRADIRGQIEGAAGGVKVFNRGTLDLKLNVLAPPNKPATHEQDEIYVVLEGRGAFVHAGRPEAFTTGDFLFVAAGVEHHFEDFESLTLWRIYYGPPGGEQPE